MEKSKLVCKLLAYILCITGVLYAAVTSYGALCIITGWNIVPYGEAKYLHINYPFTNQPFLNVDNNTSYILFSFLIPLALYTLFFLLASKVFKVFYQPRLFTQNNLKHLKKFYLLNLVIPLPVVIISSFFTEVESAIWLLVVVHFILGVFTFLT